MKLSGIIIAKNSEFSIEECLKSLSFCDEIIVVDGGSTDKTIEIAKKARAKIIEGVSTGFAEQRNKGLHEAKGEWVLYVDTDERVTPLLREAIIRYTNSPVIQYNTLKIQRKNFYFGKYPWPKIEKLERLFKKSALKEWVGKLHESPKVEGGIGNLDGFLLHYSHQDLSSMVAKTNAWSEMEAQLRLDAHHPTMSWWRFIRVMMTAFYDSYVFQGGWKVGTAGIVESIYQAFSMFITYAKLWEAQIKLKNKHENFT